MKGDFYGTTSGKESGILQDGSVYRITKYGNFTLLHTFTRIDGASHRARWCRAQTTISTEPPVGGGEGDNGTIFRISSSGDFKVLVNFDGTNGKLPYSGLIQANDGNFYGVAHSGGSSR